MTTDERLDDLQEKLAALTAIVEQGFTLLQDQARETRPMFGQIQERLSRIEAELKQINRKFDAVGGELHDLRHCQRAR
jgi:predicted nuclease with TOPRIM domain